MMAKHRRETLVVDLSGLTIARDGSLMMTCPPLPAPYADMSTDKVTLMGEQLDLSDLPPEPVRRVAHELGHALDPLAPARAVRPPDRAHRIGAGHARRAVLL